MESEFTITVTNKNPRIESLRDSRVKLGSSLEYLIPGAVDEDGDFLIYRVHWVKDDQTITYTLPSWLHFDNQNLILYGIPKKENEGSYSLRVGVNDQLGEWIETDFIVEAYNNLPKINPSILIED